MTTTQMRPLVENPDVQQATFAELLVSCNNLAASSFIYLFKGMCILFANTFNQLS